MVFLDVEKISYEEYSKKAEKNNLSILNNNLWIPDFDIKIEVTSFNILFLPEQIKQIATSMNKEILEIKKFDKKYFLNPELREQLENRLYDYVQKLNEILSKEFKKPKIWLNYNHNIEIIIKNFKKEVKKNKAMSLRAIGALFNTVFIGPKRLLIDPSIKCNLDCYFCRSHAPAIRKLKNYKNIMETSKEFHFDYIEDNIKEIKELGVEQICIVGSGEPLVYKRFFNLLNLIAKNDFIINFSTNGLLLTKERIKESIAKLRGAITVSISAIDSQAYIKIHPMTNEKTFTKIINNMKDICELKQKENPNNLTMVYLFVITKDNYHQILEVPKFAKELGFDMIQFQLLHVENFSKQYQLSKKQSEQLKNDIIIAENEAKELGLRYHGYANVQLEDFNSCGGTYSENTFQKYGCLVGWQFSFLDHQGIQSLCCGSKKIDILYKQSFKEQWESETYSYYRRKARQFDKTTKTLTGLLIDDFCLSCDNVNFQEEMSKMVDLILESTDENYYNIYSNQ